MRTPRERLQPNDSKNGWLVGEGKRIKESYAYKTRCPKCGGAEKYRTQQQLETTKSCAQCDKDSRRKTVCTKGHPVIRRFKDGRNQPHCKTCHNVIQARWREKQRAKTSH